MADEGKWKSLSFDFGPIKELAEGIQKLTDTVATILTIVKTATEIIATLATNLLSPQALIIKTALQVIEDTLKQFIEGGAKIHMLTVPPRRFLPALDTSLTDWTPDNNPFTMTGGTVGSTQARNFYADLDSIFSVEGGNPAYGRIVLESLTDEGDINRPQYDDTNAYFGLVLLSGTTSILELLGYISRLMMIFRGGTKTSMMPPDIAPPPQDVRTTVIAPANVTRLAIRVNWTNAPTEKKLTLYGADPLFTRIEEVAIIRSTDPESMRYTMWSDFFGNYQPPALTSSTEVKKDLKTVKTKKGEHKLIRIFKYDGVRDYYHDDDKSLPYPATKDTQYYYTAAYRYSMATPDLNGKILEKNRIKQIYSTIGNVSHARFGTKIPTLHGGVYPDWEATPSVLDLFPDLKFFLALLQSYVETLKSQVSGAANALQSYITFLKTEIDRYIEYANEINRRVAALTELMRFPQGGIYVTLISGEKGGTSAFLAELTKRLTDEADTTAPPYFRHGVTCGMVLFAGAPNPAALASTQALISLLTGFDWGASALQQAIDSIDQLIDSVSPPELAADLQPGDAPVAVIPEVTFDDSVEPVAADDETANIPFDP